MAMMRRMLIEFRAQPTRVWRGLSLKSRSTASLLKTLTLLLKGFALLRNVATVSRGSYTELVGRSQDIVIVAIGVHAVVE